MKDYYEIVSGGELTDCRVREQAPDDQIENAITELTKEVHPDQSDFPNAGALMSDLNTIKDVLRNHRREYDAAASHAAFVDRNPNTALGADWSVAIPDRGDDETETDTGSTGASGATADTTGQSGATRTGDAGSADPGGSSGQSNPSGSRFDETASHDRDPDPANRGAMHDSAADSTTAQSDADIHEEYDDPANHDDKYPPDWDARRRAVYERDNFTCQNCGTQSGPHAGADGVPLHAHHVVPVSKGGSNATTNLVTLCQECHDLAHVHDIFDSETAANSRSQSARTQPNQARPTSPAQDRSGGTLSEEEAQKAREDERFIGGVLQFVVATPLYVYALSLVPEILNSSLVWGLSKGVFAAVVLVGYVGICAAYTTRTVWYSGIYVVIVTVFADSITVPEFVATVALFGAPLAVAEGLKRRGD